ncbi:MAG: Stp1/IreP family PP2C-type Ser/Thr phosphatase [Syntrophomonadaceae bacterium]
MKVAAITDLGLHRKRNEDRYWIDMERGIFIVCDGMGGHRGGDVAAKMTIETMQQNLLFTDYEKLIPVLLASIEKANQVVYEKGRSDPELFEMGTTITAAVIQDKRLTVAHVGDSSLFRFHQGQLGKITRDHTLAERLRQEGLVEASDMAVNRYKHVLTRAVGVDPQVDIDLIQMEVLTGDWILLCTDGLTDMISDREIAQEIRSGLEPQDLARKLVDQALQKGGFDNITVVLISI